MTLYNPTIRINTITNTTTQELTDLFTTDTTSFVIILIVLLGIASYVLMRILAFLMARSIHIELAAKQTLIAEYDPPQGLTAVELGYLFDRRFGKNELLAILLTLSNKKLLSLGSLGGEDFSISLVAGQEARYKALDNAELAIIAALQQESKNKTTWGQMSSVLSGMAGTKSDFESGVLQDLYGKNIVYKTNLDNIRLRTRIISGIVAFAIVVFPLWLTNPYGNTDNQFVLLGEQIVYFIAILCSLALWIPFYFYSRFLVASYTRKAGVPVGLSDDAKAVWPDVVGYREFISKTESHRLAVDPSIDDPSLPYCVALGLNVQTTLENL